MINVPQHIQSLFQDDSVPKNFRISFPNGERIDITNDNIVSESVKFTESISSGDEFDWGNLELSTLQFQTAGIDDINGCIIDAQIEVKMNEGEQYDNIFIIDGRPTAVPSITDYPEFNQYSDKIFVSGTTVQMFKYKERTYLESAVVTPGETLIFSYNNVNYTVNIPNHLCFNSLGKYITDYTGKLWKVTVDSAASSYSTTNGLFFNAERQCIFDLLNPQPQKPAYYPVKYGRFQIDSCEKTNSFSNIRNVTAYTYTGKQKSLSDSLYFLKYYSIPYPFSQTDADSHDTYDGMDRYGNYKLMCMDVMYSNALLKFKYPELFLDTLYFNYRFDDTSTGVFPNNNDEYNRIIVDGGYSSDHAYKLSVRYNSINLFGMSGRVYMGQSYVVIADYSYLFDKTNTTMYSYRLNIQNILNRYNFSNPEKLCDSILILKERTIVTDGTFRYRAGTGSRTSSLLSDYDVYEYTKGIIDNVVDINYSYRSYIYNNFSNGTSSTYYQPNSSTFDVMSVVSGKFYSDMTQYPSSIILYVPYSISILNSNDTVVSSFTLNTDPIISKFEFSYTRLTAQSNAICGTDNDFFRTCCIEYENKNILMKYESETYKRTDGAYPLRTCLNNENDFNTWLNEIFKVAGKVLYIDRNGKLQILPISDIINYTTASILYPSNSVYPNMYYPGYIAGGEDLMITPGTYIECDLEDTETLLYGVVTASTNDVTTRDIEWYTYDQYYCYPEGEHPFSVSVVNEVVQDQPFIYTADTYKTIDLSDTIEMKDNFHSISTAISSGSINFPKSEVTKVCQDLLTQLSDLRYYPVQLRMKGLPYIQCMDSLAILVQDKFYNSYVLRQTISGIQSLITTIDSK